MQINDYIKLNDTNPEEALLKVDYNTLLPMFDKYYTEVYQGNVKFINFPYMEEQYINLSRKYYMEGIADLTVLMMHTIYQIAIDRKEHKFMKIRPVPIDTGQTTIISGEARGGKSSLALWLAYALYGDWDVAIAHIIIDPLQLDDLIEAMKTYLSIPSRIIKCFFNRPCIHLYRTFNSIKDYPTAGLVEAGVIIAVFQFHQGLSGLRESELKLAVSNNNSFNSIKDYLGKQVLYIKRN